MKSYSILLVVLSIALVGCTAQVKSPEEFWFGQGYRFGSAGYDQENSFLANIKERVPFDQKSYLAGYKKGLSEYCDPFEAFAKGRQGTLYTGQCDGHEQEIQIKADWQRGWDAFVGQDFFPSR
ncbi:DUF2799 domain-containing protein [Vibrio sp. SCSIO 43136]|uniref:DUF2799 domain-containing protein n=1 Tax=Vibrio sp. SCSIO 43136 TaxID=2819101 RepID=UPI0020759ACC|nr:DUF2799 domain-containing protein [Vibrio sp. SCSIO 43136]USD64586.1 DUF2799 domain-containing protein [Vibrio sp. SCSIO 43136]